MHMYLRTYVHAVGTYIQYIHTYIQYIQYIHTYIQYIQYIHTYVHTVHTYICMYIRMCVVWKKDFKSLYGLQWCSR